MDYLKPKLIGIPKALASGKLYLLEEKLSETFSRVAEELGKIRGYRAGEFYSRSIPQAIFDFLELQDDGAAKIAAESFLEYLKQKHGAGRG